MKKSKYHLKQTKRLLKELGIYSEFIRERRKYLLYYKNVTGYDNPTFNVIFLTVSTLNNLLFSSFTWNDTENPLLWQTLYNKLSDYGMSNKAILNDSETIEELKKIVKNTQNE